MKLPKEEITPDGLKNFSREQLEALVLELYHQAIKLQEQISQLTGKPKKDSGNSSTPPSKDEHRKRGRKYFGREKSGKPSGGQTGHTGQTREWNEHPNGVVTLVPKVCSGCGGHLLTDQGECIDKRQLIDIPPQTTTTTEYHQLALTCHNCQTVNTQPFPEYCSSRISLGHNLHLMTGYFFHVNYGSYERTQAWLQDIYHLHLSEGTIANILDRIDDKLEPCIDRITNRVINGKYVGSDETQTWINKQKRWTWIWQNSQDVLLKVMPHRDAYAIETVIGGQFTGIWISDRLRAQLKADAIRRQLCLAHLDRDARYIIQAEGRAAGYRLYQWLHSVMSVWRQWYQSQSTSSPPAELKVKIINQFYEQLTNLCQETIKNLDKRYRQTRILFKDLWKYRNHLLTCLVWEVPFHNNDSERPLRHGKNQLKISGGFRSERGANQYVNFMSVYHTARRRNLNAYEALYALTR